MSDQDFDNGAPNHMDIEPNSTLNVARLSENDEIQGLQTGDKRKILLRTNQNRM